MTGSLFAHRDFVKLWTAQSTSLLGSCVSGFALPTLAVTTLAATAGQMAAISAIGALAFPVLGLFAATLVERWNKQVVLIAMDLGRMLCVAAIPALWLSGRLSIGWIVLSTALVAAMSVFHDIAYQSHLPAVVPRDRIGEGNTKLELSNTASQSAGPALGGFIIHVLSAPVAIFADALSYLVSALSVATMQHRPRTAPAAPRRPCCSELFEGLRFVAETPRLGRIALCTATMNFGTSMTGVVSLIFLYRIVHLEPFAVGLLFAFSNFGFVGALYAIKLSGRLGLTTTLSAAVLLNAVGRMLLPLAAFAAPVACAFASLLLSSLAGPVYNVAQLSYRQRVTPLEMQARMHAAMRSVNSATSPLGAVAGGVLAGSAGIEPTLVISALITACAAGWFIPVARRPAGVLATA